MKKQKVPEIRKNIQASGQHQIALALKDLSAVCYYVCCNF
jgi:hypothetical protein